MLPHSPAEPPVMPSLLRLTRLQEQVCGCTAALHLTWGARRELLYSPVINPAEIALSKGDIGL